MIEVHGARFADGPHRHVPLRAAVEADRVLLSIGGRWVAASPDVAREFAELIQRAADTAAGQATAPGGVG